MIWNNPKVQAWNVVGSDYKKDECTLLQAGENNGTLNLTYHFILNLMTMVLCRQPVGHPELESTYMGVKEQVLDADKKLEGLLVRGFWKLLVYNQS